VKNVLVIYEKYICYVYKTKMVKLNQGLTLGVLLVVIVIMILKPNLLGFLYNNVLGKLIFVAAIVFLSLKHTAAGLLAVVFVALIASMTGYYGFEGMEVPGDEEKDDEEGFDPSMDPEDKKNKKTEGLQNPDKEKCTGDNCESDAAKKMKDLLSSK
jgi:hypothetical protein